MQTDVLRVTRPLPAVFLQQAEHFSKLCMQAAAVPRLDRGQHPFPPFRLKPVAEVLRGFDVIHRENTVFTQIPFLVSGSPGLPIGCRQLGKAAHPFTDTDRHTQL
ncbi:hypothetical protein D3C75_991260 [compost metagenome]